MILIPPYCHKDTPSSEKKVFNALKNDKNIITKNWIVYHSLNYPVSISKPKSINDAVEQIVRHKSQIKQLRNENELMAEAINRLIYNGSLHGLSEQQLMKPLPQKSKD